MLWIVFQNKGMFLGALQTRYSKHKTFQLFAIAVTIKKFRDSQHPDTVYASDLPANQHTSGLGKGGSLA